MTTATVHNRKTGVPASFSSENFQGQTTLEKNDGDKEPHQTKKGRFIGEIVIDSGAGELRQRKTKDEKEKNGGKFQSPGGPLGHDAKK